MGRSHDDFVKYPRTPHLFGSRRTDDDNEDYRCTVTMMSGLPGRGKDTWLAANCPDLPVVSLDELRCELDIEATDDQGQIQEDERCWIQTKEEAETWAAAFIE